MNTTASYRSEISISEENARFMSGVYKWMTFGIMLTAFISFYVSQSRDLLEMILGNKIVFYGLIIAQLGAVFFLSAKIKTISATAATCVYLLYAALTGLTLSVIFVVYTSESIQSAFILTSFSFAGLSAFGYITKRDLGPIGTFCHMALWGMIGFGILTMFFPSLMSTGASKIYGICGVVIFSGLTAYDTQKIKSSNIIGNEGTEEDKKETIFGALTLYLDFINLFLSILRLMGNRRK
ncbi:Bax inhibitor-1 family protein [Halobacteriovorax sp.]|uniref:Bax inhibitor-1/YccA family protein n=1 Tax=Halobacteriovorax sp. TaxID=2020862 RepID=UPI00356275E2